MKKLLMMVMMVPCLAGASVDLYPIGGAFGSRNQWQFGLDKALTAGACIQREVHDGQWLAGPCRDFFVLVHDNESAAHLGGAVMYNAERGNATYSIRAGVNVGPAAKAFLWHASQNVPYLESLAEIKVPKWAAYIGSISTFDYAVGYRPNHTADVIGNWTHGPMFKLDFPLEDLFSLIKLGI